MSNDNQPGVSRQQFSLPLICPDCRQEGTALWEESGPRDRDKGPQRRLVKLSNGFHAESGRTESGDPLIVCDRCDCIQAD